MDHTMDTDKMSEVLSKINKFEEILDKLLNSLSRKDKSIFEKTHCSFESRDNCISIQTLENSINCIKKDNIRLQNELDQKTYTLNTLMESFKNHLDNCKNSKYDLLFPPIEAMKKSEDANLLENRPKSVHVLTTQSTNKRYFKKHSQVKKVGSTNKLYLTQNIRDKMKKSRMDKSIKTKSNGVKSSINSVDENMQSNYQEPIKTESLVNHTIEENPLSFNIQFCKDKKDDWKITITSHQKIKAFSPSSGSIIVMPNLYETNTQKSESKPNTDCIIHGPSMYPATRQPSQKGRAKSRPSSRSSIGNTKNIILKTNLVKAKPNYHNLGFTTYTASFQNCGLNMPTPPALIYKPGLS